MSALATQAAMRERGATVWDVTIRVCPNLQQVVGLPEELKGIELLTTGKSIDLRSNTRSETRLWQMEGLQELAALLGWYV